MFRLCDLNSRMATINKSRAYKMEAVFASMNYYGIGTEILITFGSYFVEKRYAHSNLCSFLHFLRLLILPYPF